MRSILLPQPQSSLIQNLQRRNNTMIHDGKTLRDKVPPSLQLKKKLNLVIVFDQLQCEPQQMLKDVERNLVKNLATTKRSIELDRHALYLYSWWLVHILYNQKFTSVWSVSIKGKNTNTPHRPTYLTASNNKKRFIYGKAILH